jgi:hypothetical protein
MGEVNHKRSRWHSTHASCSSLDSLGGGPVATAGRDDAGRCPADGLAEEAGRDEDGLRAAAAGAVAATGRERDGCLDSDSTAGRARSAVAGLFPLAAAG